MTHVACLLMVASAVAQTVPTEQVTPPPDVEAAAPPTEPAKEPPAPPPASVSVSEHGTVSLAAQGIEITKLLELLSIKSRMNIVASEKVKAQVSVSLYDVPIDQALDALLTVNGFVWERQGPFIMVYTRAEKETMDKAKMKRDARVFTLQFLGADDALSLVKPVLTEGGTAVSLGKVKEGYEPTIADGGSDTYAFATRVLVNDYPDVLEKVAGIFRDSDMQPQQVRVEATILVTDVNEEDAFGLDISLVGKIDFAQVTNGPMAAFDGLKSNSLNSAGTYPDPVPSSASTASLFPVTEADPTLKMGVLANDVAVFLQMLDQVKNTTVLARPSVTVLNRQKAQVNIGAKVGYLSTTQTQTSTTQEVQYIDTGIKLTFRAFISPDGMVRMELAPSIINAEYKTVQSVTGTGTGPVQIPNQTNQELRTNVRVKSGQTIVLGGLFREDSTSTNRQIPGLGDVVPGLFSGQNDKTVRQEVIFLVTPTIVQDPKSEIEGDRALKVIDAVQASARAGLLPFSHQQIGGHYQLQALDAWRQGDRERAALYADQALRVGPTSPSMIQLREDIRADNAAPWRNKLDSLDLLPDHVRRNGTMLGFPQGVPAPKPDEVHETPATAAPAAMEPAPTEELP
jgi:type II secretory pathway component GspD/PulD (secretin)